MNENLPNFMKIKDDALYYKGTGSFIFYIPESFFEHNHAFQEGETVITIGVLNWVEIKKDDDPIKAITKAKPFTWPTAISIRPGSIIKGKNLKIIESQKAQDFRILRIENNDDDQILSSLHTVEDIANVEHLSSIFTVTGKIPPGISYHELYKYYEESINLNGASFGLPMQQFGLLFSEICRSQSDYSKPFRLTKDLDKDPYSYTSVSIKEIPKLVSPFTSVTTENWDKAVISAAIIDKEDIKDTPMERIMID